MKEKCNILVLLYFFSEHAYPFNKNSVSVESLSLFKFTVGNAFPTDFFIHMHNDTVKVKSCSLLLDAASFDNNAKINK